MTGGFSSVFCNFQHGNLHLQLASVSVAGQAFPQFYFMSSADLLDVLSNGNNPARVVHHFPKFFNAIEAPLY
jgi:hypothetical protein